MTPDDVCKQHESRPIKLQVRDLGEVILIEGTSEALEFLGKILTAQSTAADDGFEIGPRGPGAYFFDRNAEKGFYIHRIAREERIALGSDPATHVATGPSGSST